jgi:ectoine hydroxylase-related dioxygenase (phytanoyl-CoA dioxygenase family)
MNLSDSEISSFSINGFLLKKNILNVTEIETLKKIVKSLKEGKGREGSDFPVKLKSFIIKFAKFEIKKIFNSFYLHKINNKLNFKSASDKLFNNNSKLNHIDCYHNKITKKEILPWHCDQAHSGAKSGVNLVSQEKYYIKFFFYLTAVGPENGCTSYLPGSHKITYALRTCLFNKEIEYRPFWSINDFLNLVLEKENYEKIVNKLESKLLLEDFIEKANLVINNDTNIFDFKANPGDLLLFNDGGFHRGSKPTLNERAIVRYMYLKNF